MTALIDAVLFDLDDTLYLQSSFLAQVWHHVAQVAASESGRGAEEIEATLVGISAQGSDRGGIIDRAVEQLGISCPIEPLVEAFRTFTPTTLSLLPGARAVLDACAAQVPIGLVSDGVVELQRAKLAALGLEDSFDVVVLSDTFGREHRKPDPTPFLAALEALGTSPEATVFVGDRPDKDVVGAHSVGMRALRVHTGEYSQAPDPEGCWASVPSIADVEQCLVPLLVGRR